MRYNNHHICDVLSRFVSRKDMVIIMIKKINSVANILLLLSIISGLVFIILGFVFVEDYDTRGLFPTFIVLGISSPLVGYFMMVILKGFAYLIELNEKHTKLLKIMALELTHEKQE